MWWVLKIYIFRQKIYLFPYILVYISFSASNLQWFGQHFPSNYVTWPTKHWNRCRPITQDKRRKYNAVFCCFSHDKKIVIYVVSLYKMVSVILTFDECTISVRMYVVRNNNTFTTFENWNCIISRTASKPYYFNIVLTLRVIYIRR